MLTTQLRNPMDLWIFAVSATIASTGCGGSHSTGAPTAESTAAEGTAAGTSGLPKAAASRYEAASVLVPAGATCIAHPSGNPSSAASIPVRADADGVARFVAVRPTLSTMVASLDLDCTHPDGSTKTYVVDLRSDDTFAPRPFDGSRTTFDLRPALTGDPLRYTEGELIKGGYGLRPDPEGNPDGYARWRAAASIAAYKIPDPRRQPSSSGAPPSSSAPGSVPAAGAIADAGTPELAGSTLPVDISATVTSSGTAVPWTGAILTGSYQPNANPALTTSYLWNEATFNVPHAYVGSHTGYSSITIWNGLDNVFQAIVGLNITPTAGSYWINHQAHIGWTAGNDNGPGEFSPAAGDSVYAQEWYCDAQGNKNLSGGYACTSMTDITQSATWDCTVPSGKCPSYTLKKADITNHTLGYQAEYIVENDTADDVYNQPAQDAGPVWGSNAWGNFETITMTGRARVVQGNGADGNGQWVNTTSDPSVQLAPDWASSVPLTLAVSLDGANGVQWTPSFPATLVIEGKCIGLPGSSTTDGTEVQISQCKGGPNQEWVFSANGTIRPLRDSSVCLDLADSNTANGTAIDVWHCNGGENQQWNYDPVTSELESAYGGCIDNPAANTADGTPFQYHTCNGGENQQFVLATATRLVLGDSSSLTLASCLDLPDSQTANGTQLDVWRCNGNDNQLWLAGTDGSIRTAIDATKCIDLKEGNTANGTPIQIYDCHGSNNQFWVFPSYTIVGEGEGCVNDPGSDVTNGTKLEYHTCNGGSNQTFYMQ